MRKLQLHRITVKNMNPDNALTGSNCKLFLDGKPLEGVVSMKVSVSAKSLAKVNLEMLVSELELDSIVSISKKRARKLKNESGT